MSVGAASKNQKRRASITSFRLELAGNLLAAADRWDAANACHASVAGVAIAAGDEDEDEDGGDVEADVEGGYVSETVSEDDDADFDIDSDGWSGSSTDDDSDELEDFDVRVRPAGSVRHGGAPQAAAGAHGVCAIHHVQGAQHCCGHCKALRAQIYCAGCKMYLCLNSKRNCYNAHHKL
jgi:hypothetical protein